MPGLGSGPLSTRPFPRSWIPEAPGPSPPRRRLPGWGRAGSRRRSAQRRGCARGRESGGGEGGGGRRREEGAASPAPLRCPPPSHYLGRKREGRRGREWEPAETRVGTDRGRRRPSHASSTFGSRRQGDPRGPRVWAPSPPPGAGRGSEHRSAPGRRCGSKESEAAASRPPELSGRGAAARVR